MDQIQPNSTQPNPTDILSDSTQPIIDSRQQHDNTI